jgi:GDP-L-fucose synthase
MDYWRKKKVLVAGAAGLVGSHLLAKCKGLPDTRVRSIYQSRRPEIQADNIIHVQADLSDLENCKKAVEDIDLVIMLASRADRRPINQEYLIHNLNVHYNMLEASLQANVTKYLWLGSATAYPPSEVPLVEKMMFMGEPADAGYAFAWTARFMRGVMLYLRKKIDRVMSVISLRPTAIYGEYGDFNLATCHVLPALIRKVVDRQKPIEIWGDGGLLMLGLLGLKDGDINAGSVGSQRR